MENKINNQEFLIQYIAILASINTYQFNLEHLTYFVDECKKNNLYNELLNDINPYVFNEELKKIEKNNIIKIDNETVIINNSINAKEFLVQINKGLDKLVKFISDFVSFECYQIHNIYIEQNENDFSISVDGLKK